MSCPPSPKRVLLSALLAAFLATPLGAQTPAPEAAPPAAPSYPQPTVTKEMGDVGGKYFGAAPDPARTRHYYIAAETQLWNFTPEGRDPICGKVFPSPLLMNRTSWKIRYVQYADPSFTARVIPNERLGIMGPALRGIAGDYIAVTLFNRSYRPVSMHPHGVRYDKDSEGSLYQPSPGRGAAIAPGAKFTYVWHLDEGSAPRADEPSSKAWLYHSHVAGDEEINLGLVGMIIVTDPARARADGTPRDVGREMAALFMIFDESNMPDFDNDEPDERAPTSPTGPVKRTWAEVQQFTEEGERHTINGRAFGNLAGLDMNVGERVRWYMFGLGSEKDFHTANWHGQRVTEGGRRGTDVVELLPGTMKTADMRVDNPGQWLLHCHVADHMSNGMFARYTVHPEGSTGASRLPENAFFGMPQALQTLRIQRAEFVRSGDSREIDLDGQVTVRDPYPVARNPISVGIGSKTITFQPDGSGVCVTPEAMLVVKNAPPYGNGNVIGGIMKFELILKGQGWVDELRRLGILDGDSLAQNAKLSVNLQAGTGHHSAVVPLKIAEK